ncbi:CRP-like cAMP-binding protein [Motilibacter peucedani]|uniref:CRP-like cAMP-binding protein n=1 Tax=Motilibacter peucedani TaxID=598650 RepID=A0A420XKH6_9ACTN|nr:CRP-like cAMP-binding protein [Motilibacter peucedani]
MLGATPLFGGLGERELAGLAGRSTARRLRRGQLLFVEGELSEHLYVVASGRVKVLVTSPRGEELLLSVVGPGDALGELSVLDGLPRSATAEAIEDTTLVSVPSVVVAELLASSPGLALSWAQELSASVRRLTGSTSDLVFLDLPRRLAKFLLGADSGGTVELGLSQSELAARLGVARQSLNRALSSLQNRGWVRVDGARVVIHDRPALERFSSS